MWLAQGRFLDLNVAKKCTSVFTTTCVFFSPLVRERISYRKTCSDRQPEVLTKNYFVPLVLNEHRLWYNHYDFSRRGVL